MARIDLSEMKYTIQAPEKLLPASILLSASKSISNRVLILNALSQSIFPVKNLSDSDDTKVMHNAFSNNKYEINIGAAGTSMRFLTAYLSQIEGEEHIITGTERMKNRPTKNAAARMMVMTMSFSSMLNSREKK